MLLGFIQIYCLVGYSFFFFHLPLAIWGRQTVLDSRWVFLDMSPFWDCTTYKNFIKNDFINIIIWPGGMWDLPWPGMEAVHPVQGAWSLNYFPHGSVVKNPPACAGDMGMISGLGSSPGGGNGNPLHYSCLENPMQSCIFAWEIPWTEEPGRLWSMGLQSQKGLSDWITTTRKVHNGFIRVTLTSSPTRIHCILSLLPLHHGQLGGSLSSSFIWGLALCLQTLFIFIQYHAASFFLWLLHNSCLVKFHFWSVPHSFSIYQFRHSWWLFHRQTV